MRKPRYWEAKGGGLGQTACERLDLVHTFSSVARTLSYVQAVSSL